MVVNEAVQKGMWIKEVEGTRTTVSNLEGVIFEITLHPWQIYKIISYMSEVFLFAASVQETRVNSFH